MISKFVITGIAAVNQQNILGINGKMPWGQIKGDLAFYKQMTLNKTLVCGGNTYKSLPKAALANRQTFVITRQEPENLPENVHFINEFPCPGFIIDDIKDKAISKEIMIIGGGLIYQAFQEQYDKFYLTEISGKDFTTKNKEVTYFETDLKKRIAEKQWTNKIIDWFIEENHIGKFDVKIQEWS
ncbi:MAG: dihydrofolate reductase [Gammaproteobacteria bacterium]|nr:dihydrofolate reductase [Gammaproteobacteria bacterium]